jgi:hypothetical protein
LTSKENAVRLSTVVASVAGVAALAAVALAGPAAASPATTGPQAELGGDAAGYMGSGSVPVTSMSATWSEPAALPCAAADENDFVMEFGVMTAGGHVDKRIDADVECFLGYHDDTLYMGQDPFGEEYAGAWTYPIGAGDKMVGTMSLVDSKWNFTIQDLSQGWTWQRSTPADGVDYYGAYAGMSNVGYAPTDGLGELKYSSVAFTSITVNGHPMSQLHPVAQNHTQPDGSVDKVGPISGGGFTVTRTS